MRHKWMKVLAGVTGSLLFVSGCAAVQMRPGAERVIVTRTPAPKSCKFAGALVGNQGGAWSGPFTSNENLARGAMNDLRNQALDLGANYVVLETNQAGNTVSGTAEGGISGQQTDVTSTGNAYRCPPEEIGL